MRQALAPVLFLALALPACGDKQSAPDAQPAEREAPEAKAEAAAEVDAEAAADPNEVALEKADAAAMALVGKLKGRLMAAMSEGGPKSALDVCANEGQSLTTEVGASAGVTVGRSSLRLRNPKNAAPDWVQAWLDEQGERKVEGVKGIRRVDETADGAMARIVKPIVVEPPCLNCHGNPDELAPEIKSGLQTNYPEDHATGYAVGDLRGALWAEVKVGS